MTLDLCGADELRRLLSRAAKDMPADERRRFRAFLAEQDPKPSKKRRVHSWKKKPKGKPKISKIKVRAQLKLDLPNN